MEVECPKAFTPPHPIPIFPLMYDSLRPYRFPVGISCDETLKLFTSIEEFVEAFYTNWLFEVERVILGFVARKLSTDSQALELTTGHREQFSAWNLEY